MGQFMKWAYHGKTSEVAEVVTEAQTILRGKRSRASFHMAHDSSARRALAPSVPNELPGQNTGI